MYTSDLVEDIERHFSEDIAPVYELQDVGNVYHLGDSGMYCLELDDTDWPVDNESADTPYVATIAQPNFFVLFKEELGQAIEACLPTTTGFLWEVIKNRVENSPSEPASDFDFQFEEDVTIKSVCLGTRLGVYPSGKIYAFWTSNQTVWDVVRDAHYHELLEKETEAAGLFLYENDSSDVFVCKFIESEVVVWLLTRL